MNARVDFSFDGFGINGSDEYRSRLATLTDAGKALNVGPLLAAAPDMRGALILVEEQLTRSGFGKRADGLHDHADNTLAVIRRALRLAGA